MGYVLASTGSVRSFYHGTTREALRAKIAARTIPYVSQEDAKYKELNERLSDYEDNTYKLIMMKKIVDVFNNIQTLDKMRDQHRAYFSAFGDSNSGCRHIKGPEISPIIESQGKAYSAIEKRGRDSRYRLMHSKDADVPARAQ